ncbi:MAG: hypothetical protein HY939_07910 [Gammaproteobacteria bacterium]|nr:hypothetical protein [Gammaproteobacteria bacterium]
MKLSVPAKNFILGEYAVLEQGTALLFTHTPFFKLVVSKGVPQLSGIAPQSPAGLFYQQHFDFFSTQHITFIDPFHGIGGLGASSAQFILLFTLYNQQQNHAFSLDELLDTYQAIAWHGEGYPPSGADLVAQAVGGMLAWDAEKREVIPYDWPFAETLSFHLVHTKNKIKTHEHLQALQLNFSLDAFKHIVNQALDALDNRDADEFCHTINKYERLLRHHQLTATHTLRLLNSLKKVTGVKAAKGCGALGSDVLFIVLEKNHEAALHDWIKKQGLLYLSNQNDIASGLSL